MATSVPVPERNAATGWAERAVMLASQWQSESVPEAREAVLGQLWLIVNSALRMYLRQQGRRYGVSHEDQCDIASRKALDLLQKFDGGEWDPVSRGPASLCTFLATLARNGLIDHVRVVESKRHRSLDWSGREVALDAALRDACPEPPIELGADRAQFATALRDCAAQLTPRARKAWMLRVFYEQPSREIAAHPDVAMKPATVDVTLARCRDTIRRCMAAKGFEPGDIPPGAFVTLWEEFCYDPDGEA